MKDSFWDFVRTNKLTIMCVIFALIAGILFFIIGFFETILVGFIVIVAYMIGKGLDAGLTINQIIAQWGERIKNFFK